MSFPHSDSPLPPSNMSGIHVLSGARNVVVSGTVNVAETINYNLNLSHRTTSGAAIPLMPNSSPRFTGRTEILAKLKDHFARGPDSERRSRKYFLLRGMGGIGKTQICLRFIEEMSDKFSHVFWIDASSTGSVIQGLKGICNLPAAQTQLLDGSPESALSWIGSLTDNFAIVFDNADALTSEELEGYFPPGLGGNILITSRNPAMQRLTSPENSYEVGEMEKDDAILLLLKAACLDTSRPELKVEASEIVKKLYNMPLAIDQAGAYIASGPTNIRNYLLKYNQHRETLLSHSEFKGASKYNRTVYGTWELSYEEIQRRAMSDDLDKAKAAQSAILILGLFVFFHYDCIMKDIFSYAAVQKHHKDHHHPSTPTLPIVSSMVDCTLLSLNEAGTWDDFIFEEGLRVLLSFCLIKLGLSDGLYTVHPLIHTWGRDRMSLDERKKYGIMAYAILSDSLYDGYKMQPYGFRRALVTHVRENMQYRQIESQVADVSYFDDAYEAIGNLFLEQGYPTEALELLQQVLELRSNVLGREHYHTMTAASHLASTYDNLGRYAEAEKLKVEVLCVRKNLLEENHPHVIDAMGDLAMSYSYMGKSKEAYEMQIKVIDAMKNILGEQDQQLLIPMENLVLIQEKMGNYKAAEKLQVQVLNKRKEFFGEGHPDTVDAMGNLAALLMELKKFTEAEKLLIQAVDLSIRIHGAEHPDTIIRISNLASVYCYQGKYTEAEKLEIQVLNASKRLLGQEHPDTLINMGNLAVTYYHLGKYEEAEKLEIHILDASTRTLGAEHPNTVDSMANLADSFRHLKKYSEAEQLQIQVVELRKRILGVKHPHTRSAMKNLANTYRIMGKHVEAEGLCKYIDAGDSEDNTFQSSSDILSESEKEFQARGYKRVAEDSGDSERMTKQIRLSPTTQDESPE